MRLTAGGAASVNLVLKVTISDQLDVKSEAVGVSTEPEQNLSAINLSRDDLTSLPDDREQLLQTLRAMAGAGDATPIFVDGFSEDRLPSKDSIQAVKIGSNPFSPEFSGRGNNRMEVITKPGSDKLGGNFQFRFNDESFNARNAFAATRAPLQVRDFTANLTGPIIRKRWGYFFEYERERQDENAFINATVLDPATLSPRPFIATALTPTREDEFTIRANFLVTKKNNTAARCSVCPATDRNRRSSSTRSSTTASDNGNSSSINRRSSPTSPRTSTARRGSTRRSARDRVTSTPHT